MEQAGEIRQAGGLVPKKGRIAVYSCYFGGYEPYFAPAIGPEGDWDRILFTDQTDLPQDGRRFVHMPEGFDGLTSKQLSRLPKLCPEDFLSRYDWVIYVDNRARLRLPADGLIARIEGQMGGAGSTPAGRYLARHSQRNCAWRESRVCLRKGFYSRAEFDMIRSQFETSGFPREAGLYVNTALIQKMGSEDTARLNRAWMQAFCQIVGRDQVLLPFVMWQSGLSEQDLGFPQTDVIDWPMFGKVVRRRFQLGMPLPIGWDAARLTEERSALPVRAPESDSELETGLGDQGLVKAPGGEGPLREFKKEPRLSRRLAAEDASRLEGGTVVHGEDDMKLFRYGAGEEVDLELYRKVQTEANKMKIKNQWVPEDHIAILARYVLDHGGALAKGICHGTRRGNEQAWFRKYLGPGADVFGTEISETATEFPHTIQWDFHEVDPAWVGAMDLVYSNSWDHAHDPERAFAGWISCLRPGRFLLLDHGWNFLPERVSPMDPFGISEQGLVNMLDRVGAGKGVVTDIINGGMIKQHQIRTVVFQAKP